MNQTPENSETKNNKTTNNQAPLSLEEYFDLVQLKKMQNTTSPTATRIAGLDFGSKTIGVAISDTSQTIATGLETIRRSKFKQDSARLLEIASEHQICAFIIGLPLHLDGSEGRRAQSTKAFARNLSQITDLPLVFWDERFSTQAAERTLLTADSSRKRRKEVIDKMAATYILQGALDRLVRLTANANNNDSTQNE